LNQLNGTIPPQLGNLTLLNRLHEQNSDNSCDNGLRLVLSFRQFISLVFDAYCLVFHRRSLSDVSSNQLNGTIPPQLGNLTQLSSLYALNRIVHRDSVYDLL